MEENAWRTEQQTKASHTTSVVNQKAVIQKVKEFEFQQ
jgi:hypothetical protein